MCYEGIIHHQQRIYVKIILELVIRRIIELRHELVDTYPPNSDAKMIDADGKEMRFPWEIVHLDEVLVDLKLSPSILEMSIPRYFREDNKQQLNDRNDLVSAYMKLKHGHDEIYMPNEYEDLEIDPSLTLDQAISLIQRNERGRQAQVTVQQLLTKPTSPNHRDNYNTTHTNYNRGESQHNSAVNIQRLYRGYNSRCKSLIERHNELVFLGMFYNVYICIIYCIYV